MSLMSHETDIMYLYLVTVCFKCTLTRIRNFYFRKRVPSNNHVIFVITTYFFLTIEHKTKIKYIYNLGNVPIQNSQDGIFDKDKFHFRWSVITIKKSDDASLS